MRMLVLLFALCLGSFACQKRALSDQSAVSQDPNQTGDHEACIPPEANTP